MTEVPAGVRQHQADAPQALNVAVVTVSDSRTLETDTSGSLIVQRLESAGHRIGDRSLVPDDPEFLRAVVSRLVELGNLDALLLTGGTGIASRDQTAETIASLLTRTLPGFGELFRMLSYAEIGPAAMLSRAVGGLVGSLVVLAMPGSRAAVELAMDQLILPELPHLVREARR